MNINTLLEDLLLEAKIQDIEYYKQLLIKLRGAEVFTKNPWLDELLRNIIADVRISTVDENVKGEFVNTILKVWIKSVFDTFKKEANPDTRINYAKNIRIGLVKSIDQIAKDSSLCDAVTMYYKNGANQQIKTSPLRNIFLEPFNTSIKTKQSLNKFHAFAVKALGDKAGKKAIKPLFKSGNWEVYAPKTFEEAVFSSSIVNKDNKELNRKATWCTASHKNYFNNYPNIYIIKRLPSNKDDRGLILQMNWGKDKQEFNFKNEADFSVSKEKFEKYNIPKEVLQSIKAPIGHDLEGKTLEDVVKTDGKEPENYVKTDKEYKDGIQWKKEIHEVKNATPEKIKTEIEKYITHPDLKIQIQPYSKSNVIEQNVRTNRNMYIQFAIVKNLKNTDKLFFVLRKLEYASLHIGHRLISGGMGSADRAISVLVNLKKGSISIVKEFHANKYKNFPIEILNDISDRNIDKEKSSYVKIKEIIGKRFSNTNRLQKTTTTYELLKITNLSQFMVKNTINKNFVSDVSISNRIFKYFNENKRKVLALKDKISKNIYFIIKDNDKYFLRNIYNWGVSSLNDVFSEKIIKNEILINEENKMNKIDNVLNIFITEMNKEWVKSQFDKQRITQQAKYENVNDLWNKFKNDEIEYEDFEDALNGMLLINKITKETFNKYFKKAEKLNIDNELDLNMNKGFQDMKDTVLKKIGKKLVRVKRKK